MGNSNVKKGGVRLAKEVRTQMDLEGCGLQGDMVTRQKMQPQNKQNKNTQTRNGLQTTNAGQAERQQLLCANVTLAWS